MFNLCAQTSYYGSSNSSDMQLVYDLIETIANLGTFITILSIVSSIVMLIMAYKIAIRKGRSGGNWIVLTLLFGWIAVVIVSVSEPLTRTNSSSGYSLTKSASIANSNAAQQNYTQTTPTQQKPSWTCSCGQVNNPNAMRCINCGNERTI